VTDGDLTEVMRKWVPIIVGLGLGILAGLWYGHQPASNLPWFANAVGYVANVLAKMLCGVFSGGSEWSGIEFVYSAFLVTWVALGAILGFLVRWILAHRRHDQV